MTQTEPQTPKICFLGMGIMGSAMAFNLLRAGKPLRVWNRSQSRPVLAELAAAGASVVADFKACVSGAEVVFSCLGDEQDVLSRLTGADGSLLEFGAKGALVVDFSTIGPEAAKTINERLAGAGLRFLDAPVTGGDVGAKNATLTIMVGGQKADFEEAQPLLELLGKNIRYCGPAGAGQALKLCNQVLCAVNMVSVCEALTLARELDLDPALVVDVLQTGAGGSWALANLGKRILQEDLKPAFSLRNMLKDLRLVFASIESASIQSASIEECNNGSDAGRGPSTAANILPGSALSVDLFTRVAGKSPSAADDFGTQAMIQAYDKISPKN